MKHYRISKYCPMYRDSDDNYCKEEWTSYADIGNVYDGEVFTKEEYLLVEALYCEVISSILEELGVVKLELSDLEVYFSVKELKKMLHNKGIDLSLDEESLMKKISGVKKVSSMNLQNMVKLLLRECFWCNLLSSSPEVKISFGYDLYVYVDCEMVFSDNFIMKSKQKGIYIELL